MSSSSIDAVESATPTTTVSAAPPASPTTDAPATVMTPAPAPSPAPVPAGPAEPTAVATGLDTPWGLDALPDGRAVITERDTGRVRTVAPDGTVGELGTVAGVVPGGEGGLLGVVVAPGFDAATISGTLLVMYTAADDNRVARLTVTDGAIAGQQVVLEGMPKGRIHNGGRLAIGPDGFLYVGTGDSGDSALAQDLGSLGGKILRLQLDGSPAPGAPFPEAPLVFSLGHRNVQGLAFDAAGRLWAAEFGQNTWDELNLITAGANYGWPEVEGMGGDPRFTDPHRVWTTDEASPSGLAITGGSAWMAGLGGERLWQVPLIDETTGEPVPRFADEFGRLRSVLARPGGILWITTSNTDGRGDPRDGDDQLLVWDTDG
ncbi:PQQ-dependent sugar dehydrogenase [Nakamurella leprariae]|uniref:PQQ-dependent sugar dehydrogenase n=1 Tax=Nakamurella leprariae TaxID=2803911 RepID=A0A939BZ93_9ACTN|nr:PQQ-dependent sugar dehydrogenase [Nakamurella leprariae]MBM9467456.1 PQQ-dependent sugar dehydrogenase [Nakamurella leprariae]